jgi:hypothetical protein
VPNPGSFRQANGTLKENRIMTQDFVQLLTPSSNVELDLAKDLLSGAEIPFAVGASDRVEMLEVLEGSSAEGARCLMVDPQRLDEAFSLLLEAWGVEALAGRDPRQAK